MRISDKESEAEAEPAIEVIKAETVEEPESEDDGIEERVVGEQEDEAESAPPSTET